MLKAYLELIRAPGLFSIIANILASVTILSWLAPELNIYIADYFILLGLSLLCYQIGMMLNDVADFHVDQVERPFRPLTSGRIALRTACWLSLLLSVLVLIWAFSHSLVLGAHISVMLLLITSYNFVSKETFVGPLNMGLIRALNWLLVLAYTNTFVVELLYFSLLPLFYTMLITWISRYETVAFPAKIKTALLLIIAVMCLLVVVLASVVTVNIIGLISLVSFLVWLAWQVIKFQPTTAKATQGWVTLLLKNMVVLDGVLLLLCQQWFVALICFSLLWFSAKLAKFVYLT